MYNMYICLLDIKYTSNIHDVMLKLDLIQYICNVYVFIIALCTLHPSANIATKTSHTYGYAKHWLTCKRLFDRSKLVKLLIFSNVLGQARWLKFDLDCRYCQLEHQKVSDKKDQQQNTNPTYVSCLCLKLRQRCHYIAV